MSDTAATIDLLQAALDRDPADQVTRGVLADVVGETDPVAAEALRWLVKNDKYPAVDVAGYDPLEWSWFGLEDYVWLKNDNSDFANIPRLLLSAIPRDLADAGHIRDFRSRRQAETAFVEAYRALSERKRRGLWVREVVDV